LFELSQGLPLVFLPVQHIDPLFFDWIPHPETPESGKLGVGVRIRADQKKNTASWATALLPRAEVPLATGAVIALRLGFQDAPLRVWRLRFFSWTGKKFSLEPFVAPFIDGR
jgi:hypothetical protein